jgi:regulation of enolase protein 1 (concanavalin A-like superfamily)
MRDEWWRLVRLAPFNPDLNWKVGLFCASPTRAGLQVLFTEIKWGEPENSLH